MAITAISPHASMKTNTMKQACELTGMNYEALKFYCNSDSCRELSETRTTAASSMSGASRGSMD